MPSTDAPFHAHIYYLLEERTVASSLRSLLTTKMESGKIPELVFIGELRDQKVGPHPIPQFEIHFTESALPALKKILERSGLKVLLHPLTDDDLADHTTLAQWIGGEALDLDLAPLDPPGQNQGIARFAKTDF